MRILILFLSGSPLANRRSIEVESSNNSWSPISSPLLNRRTISSPLRNFSSPLVKRKSAEISSSPNVHRRSLETSVEVGEVGRGESS